jgi:hypothetical protein
VTRAYRSTDSLARQAMAQAVASEQEWGMTPAGR